MQDRAPRRRPGPPIELDPPRRWHLVGVGGPGMAPLAALLVRSGQTVSGSDIRASDAMTRLVEAGVDARVGHDPAHVEGVDVVVTSTGVPDDNVEILAARQLGVRVEHRSAALAAVCAATRAIGVAGAHGKTTTSALLAHILSAAGRDVAAYVGGDVHGESWRGDPIGSSTTLVVEADESDGTIEVLPLDGLAITNIDKDHLDWWHDMDGLVAGFGAAVGAAGRRGTGPIVLNADDPAFAALSAAAGRAVRTFGRDSGCDVRVVSTEPRPTGSLVRLDVDGVARECTLALRGDHNAANLACAVAVATGLGVPSDLACGAAESFAGVERRFSERGLVNGALVVDDYAHLPAEIAATLTAARDHPGRRGRVVAVFQPNRFHRIAAMADDYEGCFAAADVVVVTDIYASGTEPIEGVTGRLVVDAVARSHPRVVWARTRDEVVAAVLDELADGDVCVGMGCGDIATLADDLGATER